MTLTVSLYSERKLGSSNQSVRRTRVILIEIKTYDLGTSPVADEGAGPRNICFYFNKVLFEDIFHS